MHMTFSAHSPRLLGLYGRARVIILPNELSISLRTIDWPCVTDVLWWYPDLEVDFDRGGQV